MYCMHVYYMFITRFLHVGDIECKYGFLESENVNIERHYTGQQLTAQLRQRGQTTVNRSRINGGKLILSLF